MCLAVTCHLHFGLSGLDLLRATATTRGRNGCRNKSAQKAEPVEKNSPKHLDLLRATATTRGRNGYRNKSAQKAEHVETNSPKLLQELEPETFRSRIRRSTTEAILATFLKFIYICIPL